MPPEVWAVLGTALAALLMLVVEWIKAGQAQRSGVQLQSAAAAIGAARVETAIAAAEVDAPQTRQAVVDRLKAGTF